MCVVDYAAPEDDSDIETYYGMSEHDTSSYPVAPSVKKKAAAQVDDGVDYQSEEEFKVSKLLNCSHC